MLLSTRGFFNPEFNSIFNDMEHFFRAPLSGSERGSGVMKTDIRKEDGLYLMEMDLPGYEKEDIKIELHEGYLTVSAEHKSEEEKKDNGYIMKERHFGSCSRSFFVGKAVRDEDIQAAYKDGILHLSMPSEQSLPENQPKRIAIA